MGQTDLQSDVRSIRPPRRGLVCVGRWARDAVALVAPVLGRVWEDGPGPQWGRPPVRALPLTVGVGAGFAAERSVKTAVGLDVRPEPRGAGREEGARPRRGGPVSGDEAPRRAGSVSGRGGWEGGSGDLGRFPASGVSAGPLVF